MESIWNGALFLNRLRGLTHADLNAGCRSCGHLGRECNGGCRAAAYLAHGDIGARDPSCFMEREE